MDNAAYFFTGVLAGIAGITLLAVLDGKYGFITGTPTTTNNTTPNVVIFIKDHSVSANTDEKTDDPKDDKTEDPTTKTDDTESAENDSVQPTTGLAVA